MKYYADTNSGVFAFELDGSQDHLITSDMELLSEAEVETLLNPPPPVPTNDEIIISLTAALEAHYDATAQQRRYDTRYTCTLRAGYPGPFHTEGLAFATWMDTCNAYAYQVMADVQDGQRAIPTAAELIAELPAMVWP